MILEHYDFGAEFILKGQILFVVFVIISNWLSSF